MSHPPPVTGRKLNFNPILAGILVAVSLGALAFLLAVGWRIVFPQPVFEASMDSSCDLNAGPCTARFGDGSQLTLDIGSNPPTPLTPLKMAVEVEGFEAEGIKINLKGKNMDMGLITAPMANLGHGLFTGDTTLPVCIRGRMTWSATVVCGAGDRRYHASFEFDMTNHRPVAP